MVQLTPELVDAVYSKLQSETEPNPALIELENSFRACELYAHMEDTADRTIRAMIAHGYLPTDTILAIFRGGLELGFELGRQYQRDGTHSQNNAAGGSHPRQWLQRHRRSEASQAP
jgi:hypothetical protein